MDRACLSSQTEKKLEVTINDHCIPEDFLWKPDGYENLIHEYDHYEEIGGTHVKPYF